MGAAGMGVSAAAALHIHAGCWEPQGSHTKLRAAVTAAVGCLCLPIRCFMPPNIWEGQGTILYPCSSNEPLFATSLHLQIFWFCRFRAPCSWQSHSQPCWGASVLTTATNHHVCNRRCVPLSRTPALILTIATQLLLAHHANIV